MNAREDLSGRLFKFGGFLTIQDSGFSEYCATDAQEFRLSVSLGLLEKFG